MYAGKVFFLELDMKQTFFKPQTSLNQPLRSEKKPFPFASLE